MKLLLLPLPYKIVRENTMTDWLSKIEEASGPPSEDWDGVLGKDVKRMALALRELVEFVKLDMSNDQLNRVKAYGAMREMSPDNRELLGMLPALDDLLAMVTEDNIHKKI